MPLMIKLRRTTGFAFCGVLMQCSYSRFPVHELRFRGAESASTHRANRPLVFYLFLGAGGGIALASMGDRSKT
jgi:hypothetical protein